MEFRFGLHAIRVNVTAKASLMREVARRFQSGQGFALATLNLDHLVKLRGDRAFREAYGRHEMVTADGNPVVWLARLAGRRVDLIPGADLILPLSQAAAQADVRVGLVGTTEEALDRAATTIGASVPGVRIVSKLAPPMGFDPESPQADAMLDRAVQDGARLIFIAIGAPRQERFAARARARYPDLGLVSIGAGLDFLAGTQRRAPRLVRLLALEWLWRMLGNPRRLAGRYLCCAAILPVHGWRALAQRWRSTEADRAVR